MAAFKALVLSALLALAAHADDLGMDLLALQHPRFPVRQARQLLPDHARIGILDWTFGTSLRPVKALLTTARTQRLRVHLFNGPGLTNGQLGRYEPHFGMDNASFKRLWEHGGGRLRQHLISRTRKYCALAVPELEISPTLEHHLSPRAFRRQAKLVKKACPRAVVVSSTGFRVARIAGFKGELHGVNAAVRKAPCNWSFDGDSAIDANVTDVLDRQRACTRYVWAPPLNCRLNGPFVDPRKRTACPTRHQLRELFELLKPVPPPSCVSVPGCANGVTAVARPRLYKVWADDHGTGDPRANRPLWLSPFLFPRVRVLACNGQEVAALGYYGPFDGGGFRYYSGEVGGGLHALEMAERAVEVSGSPSVVVQEGTRCYGAFVPHLRQGYFRP